MFGVIYFYFSNHFLRDKSYNVNNSSKPEIIDCIFLSTTVQAGVGYTDLYPITNISKIILIAQQVIMIFTNAFLLYFFTL